MTDPARTATTHPRLSVAHPAPRATLAVRPGPPIATAGGTAKIGQTQTAPPSRADQGAALSSDSIRAFIETEIEARQCVNLDSLRFVITNATRKVAPYDQAFLCEPRPTGGWHVTCASSVSKLDAQTPLMRFLTSWLDWSIEKPGVGPNEPRTCNLHDDARELNFSAHDIPFAHALWLPLKSTDGQVLGALVALKSDPWQPQVMPVVVPLSGAYAHAWAALAPQTSGPGQRAWRAMTRRRIALTVTAAAAFAAFIPVPMSSLAPAEIVAAEPALITAPLDGVIQDVSIAPGTLVAKDQILLTFNDTKLKSDAEVARRNKEVAQARYFRVVQTATANQKELENLAIAKAELDVATAELSMAEHLLARAVIRAPRPGLAIYSAKSDWIGKPVHTGERIMDIGDPEKTELRIDMPVSDAISLSAGGSVALFLDGDPLTAIEGTITRIGYRPVLSADRQLVYRVHARIAGDTPRRIGLRGIARASNGDVPLWFYLLRRPIASLRQRFGL